MKLDIQTKYHSSMRAEIFVHTQDFPSILYLLSILSQKLLEGELQKNKGVNQEKEDMKIGNKNGQYLL
jgi:hypothetical protein